MSEFINNSQYRKQTLKDIIKRLHNGESVEDVKEEFEKTFAGVSANEISEAEAELIKEGVKIEEIQSLCDVHASVFKGSIEEIHNPTDPSKIPGHPLNTLMKENRKIESIIEKINSNIIELDKDENYSNLLSSIEELDIINIHYQKKENLIFPIMEKYGIVAPPQVMWGVDDEIRDMIKFLKVILKENIENSQSIITKVGEMISKINEMIFKEENIMIPMIVEKFTEDDWKTIVEGSGDFDTIVEEGGDYKA